MEPYIGQVMLFGGNFAPRGWALCQGQLLAISTHSALFSILGTIYGGDGRTTFALPDLRGRIAIQQGDGPGLPSYRLGQKGGNYQTQLLTSNLPQSNINIPSSSATSTSAEANGLVRGTTEDDSLIYSSGATTGTMAAGSIIGAQSRAFSNQPPFTTVNYIIALEGIYPSRN
ncbi:MAG: tail fiber protein, partial [Bacteroidota bacterium]